MFTGSADFVTEIGALFSIVDTTDSFGLRFKRWCAIIIRGEDALKQAYETGKAKVIVCSKYHLEKIKGDRDQIVITELPYDVVKQTFVRKIDELRVEKKVYL